MATTNELGAFLKAKRSHLGPDDLGLPHFRGRRRVPGLRREEVAHLAGVSVTYYTRLEQGHHRASDEVVLALASALRLSVNETEHLLDLAHGKQVAPQLDHVEQPSRAALDLLALVERPAVLLGRHNDVLAWNRPGHALIAPHLSLDAPQDPARRPSMPRMLFLDPAARALYRDWEDEATDYVAYLRFISGKYPDDARLTAMVGELCVKDDDFASLWASGQVGECVSGTKRLVHPLLGEVTVDFQLWAQSDRTEQRVEIYTLLDDPDGSRTAALVSATTL